MLIAIVADYSGESADVVQQLLALEQELSAAVMGRPGAEALPAPETLLQLKHVVDRVRPLLWIHLNRASKRLSANESAIASVARAASAASSAD